MGRIGFGLRVQPQNRILDVEVLSEDANFGITSDEFFALHRADAT